MRGRKPLPPALHIVRGNPGKRPLRVASAAPAGAVHKPDGLTAEAAAEWTRLAPELIRLGILTAADQAFFVAYCEAVATYRRATAKLAELGELVLDAGGAPVRNPWL